MKIKKRKEGSILTENNMSGYMILIIGVLIAVYMVGIFINAVNTRTVSVIGESMQPTYSSGDRVRVKIFTHDDDGPDLKGLNKNDIVLAKDPDKPEINVIKRVVGVPGDTIEYINGTLYINGKFISSPNKELTEKEANKIYKQHKRSGKQSLSMTKVDENNPIKLKQLTTSSPVNLDKGQFWIVSENLDIDTVDSRSFGPVYKNLIIGKVRKTPIFNIFEY